MNVDQLDEKEKNSLISYLNEIHEKNKDKLKDFVVRDIPTSNDQPNNKLKMY